MELWFNVKGRRWEEVSSCGKEGTQGGSKSVANKIVCTNLVDASTLENVIAKGVVAVSTGAEGFVSWFEQGKTEFSLEGWEEYPRR